MKTSFAGTIGGMSVSDLKRVLEDYEKSPDYDPNATVFLLVETDVPVRMNVTTIPSSIEFGKDEDGDGFCKIAAIEGEHMEALKARANKEMEQKAEEMASSFEAMTGGRTEVVRDPEGRIVGVKMSADLNRQGKERLDDLLGLSRLKTHD